MYSTLYNNNNNINALYIRTDQLRHAAGFVDWRCGNPYEIITVNLDGSLFFSLSCENVIARSALVYPSRNVYIQKTIV